MKYLIAGLGNIGDEYIGTRHNIGFSVLDNLSVIEKFAWTLDRHAHIAQYRFKGRTFVLIKPTTYMNLSGKAVKYWLDKEKIPIENLLVICDDIALPLGTLRMKLKGGDGGHNGLFSIIESLNTADFNRLRFGIGNNFAKGYQSEFVLGRWEKTELEIIPARIDVAISMIKSFGTIGAEKTMTAFNNK